MNKNFAVFLSVLTLGAAPSFAQTAPAETMEQPVTQPDQQAQDQQSQDQRQPASNNQDQGGFFPDADIAGPEDESQPQPTTIQELQQGERGGQEEAGRTETATDTGAPSTQTGFVVITPAIGAISIEDKAAFSLGTHLSFRLSQNSPLYFEPSFLVSFLSGDNNTNATLFHVDGGLRLDWAISGSPLVPFVKAAIGPTLSSSNDVVIEGDTISDSYFNAFAGGGLKVLINPNISARFDTGITFQGTDPGLYVLGAVGLPL